MEMEMLIGVAVLLVGYMLLKRPRTTGGAPGGWSMRGLISTKVAKRLGVIAILTVLVGLLYMYKDHININVKKYVPYIVIAIVVGILTKWNCSPQGEETSTKKAIGYGIIAAIILLWWAHPDYMDVVTGPIFDSPVLEKIIERVGAESLGNVFMVLFGLTCIGLLYRGMVIELAIYLVLIIFLLEAKLAVLSVLLSAGVIIAGMTVRK